MKLLNLCRENGSLCVLLAYTFFALTKRLWLPGLEGTSFWIFDIAGFTLLPIFLFRIFKVEPLPVYVLFEKHKKRITGIGEMVFYSFTGLLLVIIFDLIGRRVGLNLAKAYPDFLPGLVDYKKHIPKVELLKIAVVIYFALSAGVVEEIIYRGLTNTVAGYYLNGSRAEYVFLSTILFSVIHVGSGLANVVATAFTGFILAVMYVWSRDIRVPIAIHTIFGLIWWA